MNYVPSGATEPNVVVLHSTPMVFVPLVVETHRLADQPCHDRRPNFTPLLRRAIRREMLSETADKTISPSAARMQPPGPLPLAASEPGRRMKPS